MVDYLMQLPYHKPNSDDLAFVGENTVPTAIKISSIRRRYKNEWVVVDVTQRDEFQVPVAGKVLFSNADEEKAYDYGFTYRRQNPQAELFFFFTGEPVPEGMGGAAWSALIASKGDLRSTACSLSQHVYWILSLKCWLTLALRTARCEGTLQNAWV